MKGVGIVWFTISTPMQILPLQMEQMMEQILLCNGRVVQMNDAAIFCSILKRSAAIYSAGRMISVEKAVQRLYQTLCKADMSLLR